MTRVEISVHTALALLGAILVASYILFGVPSRNDGMPKRKKRKKGFVPGLINLGNTCFLNCILQSLASCSSFTSWVGHHTLHRAPPVLLAALRKLLNALNNEAEENFTSAEEVLRALRSHGWVIAPEEQDAHELFHALTSTLDDEVVLIKEQSNSLLNVSWVSECLNNSNTNESGKKIYPIDETKDENADLSKLNEGSNYVIVDHKKLGNTSKELSAFEEFTDLDSEELCTVDKLKSVISTGMPDNFVACDNYSVKNNRSKILNELGSVKDICQDQDIINYSESENEITKFVEENPDHVSIGLTKLLREIEDVVDVRTKNVSIISKVPSSLNQEEGISLNDTHNAMESPFKGHLASQLQCIVCGFKNAEQWSTFKSLSLFMPNDFPWGHERCTLHDLLDAFVRPERVAEVTCEGCTKVKSMPSQTTFIKQLTIGKLPECLCFHIQRTVWLENNQAIKRKEYVAFPVKINMEPYTYTVSLNQHVPESLKEGGLLGGREPFHDYLQVKKERQFLSRRRLTSSNDDDKIMGILQPNINLRETLLTFTKTVPACDMPNRFILRGNGMYTLKAVVVHVGDIFSGHFVTYRKGPDDTSIKDKWFYTSDATVREATLDEVLRSSAYMILYERLNF